MKNRSNRYTPVHERVMKRTKILPGTDACWEWQGPVNNAGYGLIKEDKYIGTCMITVHRVIGRHEGLDIKNREVQHTCLNKLCVNPDHLIEGDAKDRNERIIKKYGRHFTQVENPYITCPHCEKETHMIWYGRKHKDCYPGMLNKYKDYLKKKV